MRCDRKCIYDLDVHHRNSNVSIFVLPVCVHMHYQTYHVASQDIANQALGYNKAVGNIKI